MKIAKKFTINTIIIVCLLASTGIIASIYGLRPPEHVGHWPETKIGMLQLRVMAIINDPEMLANHVFYIITILGFGVVLLMMLNMRHQVIRPLLNAVKFALELADNNFPPKLNVPPGNTEISELITSLNFMRDRLQSTFIKLQTSHENEKNARFSAELITQLKSGFVQHITPDILESIDTIAYYVEVLHRHDHDVNISISRQEAYNSIAKALQLQTKHLYRLLDLNRISTDKEALNLKSIKSSEFLNFVVRLNAELYDSRQIRIEEEYHSTMPEQFVSDPDILRMILTMAIHAVADNAESGEAIHCSCFRKDDSIFFAVRDLKQTAMRDPLFDLYNKFLEHGSNLTTADKRLITLVVLREWVHALDGHLILINDNPNSNLEIQIMFNDWAYNQEEFQKLEVATNSRRLASITDDYDDNLFEPIPARILMAESNRELSSAAKALLEVDKHTVTVVPDVAKLKNAAEQEQFDLIAISLHMSNDTLGNIIHNIHQNSINANTPIIVISNDDEWDREQLKNGDIKMAVTRPVNFAQLRRYAGRAAAQRQG